MQRRSSNGNNFISGKIFAGRIKCKSCGGWLGAKVWHSNDKYRRVIFQCNDKYKNKGCKTPFVTEGSIKEGFVKAFNKIFDNRDEYIANLEFAVQRISDCDVLQKRKEELNTIMDNCMEQISVGIESNSSVLQDQGLFEQMQENITKTYEDARNELATIDEKIAKRRKEVRKLKSVIKELRGVNGEISHFDDELWTSLIEYATVDEKGKIKYRFKDGSEI